MYGDGTTGFQIKINRVHHELGSNILGHLCMIGTKYIIYILYTHQVPTAAYTGKVLFTVSFFFFFFLPNGDNISVSTRRIIPLWKTERRANVVTWKRRIYREITFSHITRGGSMRRVTSNANTAYYYYYYYIFLPRCIVFHSDHRLRSVMFR